VHHHQLRIHIPHMHPSHSLSHGAHGGNKPWRSQSSHTNLPTTSSQSACIIGPLSRHTSVDACCSWLLLHHTTQCQVGDVVYMVPGLHGTLVAHRTWPQQSHIRCASHMPPNSLLSINLLAHAAPDFCCSPHPMTPHHVTPHPAGWGRHIHRGQLWCCQASGAV
jgi:hypothetical protein